MKKKILAFTAIAVSFVLIFAYLYKSEVSINSRTVKSFFKDEDDYISFLKREVSFKNISLNFVTIKDGDNFWKVAKSHGVNIDTLIGANIFWEDLKAKRDQIVVVPSESGRLDFIFDLSKLEDFAREHDIEISDMEVQNLPLFYSFYYKFLSSPKPIAVFIKDAKPCLENMTAKLAGQFLLREKFRSPLGGRFSSFFGSRVHPIYNERRFHNGIDIAAPYGTLIGAARDGVVISAGWNGAYGKAVVIDHGDGYKTLYGHMSVIYASVGERVKAGKIIGRVGSTGLSTGPHLHFTLWHNDKLINPMNILW